MKIRAGIGLLCGALLTVSIGFAAQSPATSTTPADPPPPALCELWLAVPTASCGSCEGQIHRALGVAPGVHEVAVDLTTRTVRVVYDGLLADPKVLADTVTRAGYPARYLPAGAPAPTPRTAGSGCGGGCCEQRG